MSGWIKSLGKDSLVYGIGYGVSRFLQIIILPIIAQTLSLSEFGYYSNYVIFYSFTGGLFIFGLDSAVARFFFDSDDKKYHQQLFSSAFFFILLLSGAGVGLFFGNASYLLELIGIPTAYNSALKYVLFCIPAITLNGFFLSWFKWKREKAKFLFCSGSNVVFLLIPLWFAEKVSFLYIFQVILWSQLIIAVVSVYLAREYIRFYFHLKLMKSLLLFGFPWMLVFLFGASRAYLDRIFLIRYINGDAYGLYNFSVRIATLISLFITAFDMSFGPLAYSIWNKEGAAIFFARLQSIYTLLICSIGCSIAIVSPLVIHLLGGTKYAGAEKILPILLFSAIPLSLINFSNLGTAYAKKSFLSTLTLFIGFAVVLLLNIAFTRHFLAYGATSASFAGHLMIIISGYYLSAKYYKIPFAYGKDAFIFFFFFALSLISVYFPFGFSLYPNMILQLMILAIVLYLVIISLFRDEYQKAFVLLKGKFLTSK